MSQSSFTFEAELKLLEELDIKVQLKPHMGQTRHIQCTWGLFSFSHSWPAWLKKATDVCLDLWICQICQIYETVSLLEIRSLRQPANQPRTEEDWQRRAIKNNRSPAEKTSLRQPPSTERNIIKRGKQTTREGIIHCNIDFLTKNNIPTEAG